MISLDNERCRRSAAKNLKPCWGECVGEVFIIGAALILAALLFMIVTELLFKAKIISFGFRGIPSGGYKAAAAAAVCMFLLYLTLIPLKYGSAWFYFQHASSRSVPGSGFFSCYLHKKHIKGTLALDLAVFARVVPAAAVPILFIAVMAWHILSLLEKDPTKAASCLAIAAVIGAVIVYLYILFCMRYTFVPYLYAYYPEKTPKEIIVQSERITKGCRQNIIRLLFSLAPLWLCCIAIFPIAFVLPYTKMVLACAASEIIYAQESDENENNKNEAVKEKALV